MSDTDEFLDNEPPTIDPYDLLELERTATPEQVKNAYRKAALKNHPDKVPASEKANAHQIFQSIAFAYAVLSDPLRRKRYDATGSTAESVVDSDGFDWSDFYRDQYKDAVSSDAIEEFAQNYKGSDEEKDDLLIAYEEAEGDMDKIYEKVILSDVAEDDARFRMIIDKAIKDKDFPAFTAYTKESKSKQPARLKKARLEAGEAEEYAKELGVHESLFGKVKGQKSGKSSEDDLAALILKRQQDRSEGFFDHLEQKYGAASKAKKGSKKRAVEEEPSEEAFQAAASKLKSRKKTGK